MKEPVPLPDTDTLRELFDYSPLLGALTWKTQLSSRGAVGSVAGTPLKRGYVIVRVRRKTYLAHRLIWKLHHGQDPGAMHIDHINGDTTDNRIENLRLVTPTENQRNSKRQRNNASGCTGVCWDNRSGKWRADIRAVPLKQITLGYYDDWFDAVCARKSADNRYGFHENHGRR